MTKTHPIPKDFYKASNFFTLSGAAGAVWLLCLVIAGFDEKNYLTPTHFRVIAISTSVLISITMLLKTSDRKFENWLFSFFNGILIFVNASGFNAIQTGLMFHKKEITKIKEIKNQTEASFSLSFLFRNNTSWWVSNDYYLENKKLNKVNSSLNKKIKNISQNNIAHEDRIKYMTEKIELLNSINDSLLLNTQKKKEKIVVKFIEKEKTNNSSIKDSKNNLKEKYLAEVIRQKKEIDSLRKLIIKYKRNIITEDNPNVLLATINELRNRLSECLSKNETN